MSDCNTEIHLKRGDTPSFEIEVLDDDGNPVDITTAVVYFTARLPSTVNDVDDTTAKIAKIVNPPHTDPLNGITIVSLTAIDTDTPEYYVWEIQITDGGDIQSTFQGDMTIEQDITKTV